MNRSLSFAVATVAVIVSVGGCGGTQAPPTAASAAPVAEQSPRTATTRPVTSAPTNEITRVGGFKLPFTVVVPADAGIDVVPQSEVFQEFRVPDSAGVGQSAWFVVVQAVEGGRKTLCSAHSAPLDLESAEAAIDYLKSVPTLGLTQESAATLDGFPAVAATLDLDPISRSCPELWVWASDAEPVPDVFRDGFTTGRVLAVDVNGEIVVIHTWAISRAREWLPIAHALVQSIDFEAMPE